MAVGGDSGRDELLSRALIAMKSALDLLDRAEAPPQIGARLDHAICELQGTIAAAKAAHPCEPDNVSALSQDKREREHVEQQLSNEAHLDSRSSRSSGLRGSE